MTRIKERTEEAIREAANFFSDSVLDKKTISKKGYANFVTEIDYKVQDFLQNKLTEIIPGSNIITEESTDNIYKLEKPTWIVDPVDGTTNLMYSYQHSAISVALILDGEPYMGFIYDPALKEMFFAENGKGAYLNDEIINVSQNEILEDCLMGFGTTPYDRTKAEATFELVKNVFVRCRDVRRSGSAALDMAYVACGRMDGFFEMTLQPWDFAAGFIIINEAMGKTTDWHDQTLNLISPGSIISTNKLIHKEMIDILCTSLGDDR